MRDSGKLTPVKGRGRVSVGLGSIGFLALLLTHPAEPLAAQGLLAKAQGGEIGASLQRLGRWSPNSMSSSDATYRQWLRIPLRGALLSPQVLAYDLTIQPSFTQRTALGLPDALQSEELAFSFGARLFPTRVLGATVTSSRARGETSGGFGADGRFSTRSLTSTLHFRNRMLPMDLSLSEVGRDNSWSSETTVAPIEWSNVTRTLRFNARNRKLTVRINRLDFEDRLASADFRSLDTSIGHRLGWGKGSELQSTYERTERQGSVVNMRETWRERLRIRHAAALTTDWGAQRSTLTTPQGERTTASYNGGLSADVSSWGNFGVRSARRSTRFDGSRDDAWSVGPQLRATIPLARRARLSMSTAVGREWRTRQNVAGGLLDVVDEVHGVDATLSFLLEHPNALVESLQVRSADLGTPYSAGFDYQVIVLSDVIEIAVVAGGRIREGDRLLVSYRYELGDLPSGSLTTARYDASLSVRGLTVSHSRSLRDASGENGEALLGFSTFDQTGTTIVLDVRRGETRFDVRANERRRASSAFDFKTRELSSSLALPALFGIRPAFGVSARETEDRGGRFSARSAYGTIFWAGATIRASARVQMQELTVAEVGSDRSLGGTAELGFDLGRTEVQLRGEYDRRSEPTPFSGSRAFLRVARRF